MRYGENLVYVVRVSNDVRLGAVHGLISQRIYEWRCALGSSAIMIDEDFFLHEGIKTAAERAQVATDLLFKRRFLYESIDSDDPAEWRGAFRSPFVIRSVALHANSIRFAVAVPTIPQLQKPGEIGPPPIGVLALGTAALERVFQLWQHESITVQNGNATVLKSVNPKSGKESHHLTSFDDKKWGPKTQSYAISISNLSNVRLQRIVDAIAECRQSMVTKRIIFDDSDGEDSRALIVEPDSD